MLDATFIDFIKALTDTDDFKNCIEIVNAGRKIAAFDEELVLRFFAFKNNLGQFTHDVSDFLTQYMELVSDPASPPQTFNYAEEKSIFLKTFAVLNKALGDRSFAYANRTRTDIARGFSVYHFEAFTVGLQSRLAAINPDDQDMSQRLADSFRQIKLDPDFIRITTGGGKNSPGPLSQRIAFVRDRIEQIV